MRTLAFKFDALGLGLALALHAAALLYVYLTPPIPTKRVIVVEMEIRKPKPPPPPVTPPEPPKPPEPPPPPPPEPPKKLVMRPVKPVEAPKTQPPPEPPKEPPKPVFGIDPSQTGGEGISVPVGNTTMADPAKRPKVTEVPPLPPPTGAPTGSNFQPIAEEQLKKLPEIDNEDCGAAMKQKWSESETHASGVEGDVVMRIELDERGKARSVKVLKGISKEVDNIAVGFLRFDPRCRFSPALGKDGKPGAFIIDRYVVHFERER